MHSYHVIMIKETFAFKTDMRIMELEIGIEMTSDFDDQCALALGITVSDCSLTVELKYDAWHRRAQSFLIFYSFIMKTLLNYTYIVQEFLNVMENHYFHHRK